MNKFDNNITLSKGRSSLASAFYIIGIFFLGFQVIGGIIGALIALPFFEGGLLELQDAISNPGAYPSIKITMFITQIVAALIGLILLPYVYIKAREGVGFGMFFQKKTPYIALLLTPLIVISFMVVDSVIIEWNMNIDLPDFLNWFENWARESEDRAAELTTLLTTFDSTAQFLLAFLAIAIIPAIGEEIVFRGLIQNELDTAFKNIHVAIWVSAFIFSAVHMQFYGFVPRMLLGALFGYLYYWSGNLIIPMLAHFINNGFSLFLAYGEQQKLFPEDLKNSEAAPLPAVFLFLIITVGLLYYFRAYFLKLKANNGHMAKDI